MGPSLVLTILGIELITAFIQQIYPLHLGLSFTFQLTLTIVLGILFVIGYAAFIKMLRKYSMGTRVVKQGPYRLVRHPLYSVFSFTLPAFFVLWFNDGWFLLSWLAIIIFAHLIVKVEERIMAKKFGKEYLDYKSKVPALIPYRGIVQL